MFSRNARGLLDFLMAALCLWTAYHHTPAGALVRRGAAWASNASTIGNSATLAHCRASMSLTFLYTPFFRPASG